MTDTTLSQDLGTPLADTSYTLADLNAKLQRNPRAIVDALVWTREYWKWFQPRNDHKRDAYDGTPVGHNGDIWYDEAIRKLHTAIMDIDHQRGIYANPETHGLDPDWAGLIATAFEFYEEHYHHLRHGPDAESPDPSFS